MHFLHYLMERIRLEFPKNCSPSKLIFLDFLQLGLIINKLLVTFHKKHYFIIFREIVITLFVFMLFVPLGRIALPAILRDLIDRTQPICLGIWILGFSFLSVVLSNFLMFIHIFFYLFSRNISMFRNFGNFMFDDVIFFPFVGLFVQEGDHIRNIVFNEILVDVNFIVFYAH